MTRRPRERSRVVLHSRTRKARTVENNLMRYVEFPPGAHTCGRCRALNVETTMSFFDEQMLCQDCCEDETFAPNYAAARVAEKEAVKSGNQRFPGIGLADEDHAVLADRLSARRRGSAGEDTESRQSTGWTWRAVSRADCSAPERRAEP